MACVLEAGGKLQPTVEVESVRLADFDELANVLGINTTSQNPWLGEVDALDVIQGDTFAMPAPLFACIQKEEGAVSRPAVNLRLQGGDALMTLGPDDADDALLADGIGIRKALFTVQLGVVKACLPHDIADGLRLLFDEDTDAIDPNGANIARMLGCDAAGAAGVENETEVGCPAGGSVISCGLVGLPTDFDEWFFDDTLFTHGLKIC